MAWTAPMTAVANTAFTAAQFNTHVRDNLLQTAPALATAPSGVFARHFTATGANAIVQRSVGAGEVLTAQTTTSTSFTNLTTTGPSLTINTGAHALIGVTCKMQNSGNNSCLMGWEISGATTLAATDATALRILGTTTLQASYYFWSSTLTAGSNTFTAKYRVLAGTGTFENRRMFVMAF